MRNKSNALLKYLQAQGALENGNEETIQQHVRAYRKEYKREWYKNKRKCCKEITIYLSAEQHRNLADHARIFGISSITGYAKEIILSAQQAGELIPRKAELQTILQKVGMAVMQMPTDTDAYSLLNEAETILLDYLHI